MADLRNLEQAEITAVCQCSETGGGLSSPHVPGVQWGGWRDGKRSVARARLQDVLAKAGLKPGVVEIVIDGADGPPLTGTPDFVKSLPLAKAMDENTIIAIQMNGEPLPQFNGFPARLIVPGWTATYWMKHLVSIQAVTKPFDGFWMKGAYRLPTGMFPTVQRFASQENEMNTPINGNGGQFADRDTRRRHARPDGRDRQCDRGRLGRRLWHRLGCGLGRRRHGLARSDARQ
jgi:DMSO/TMAO reductase YedYZ molybdopterin-dependent catalytic subunit